MVLNSYICIAFQIYFTLICTVHVFEYFVMRIMLQQGGIAGYGFMYEYTLMNSTPLLKLPSTFSVSLAIRALIAGQ